MKWPCLIAKSIGKISVIWRKKISFDLLKFNIWFTEYPIRERLKFFQVDTFRNSVLIQYSKRIIEFKTRYLKRQVKSSNKSVFVIRGSQFTSIFHRGKQKENYGLNWKKKCHRTFRDLQVWQIMVKVLFMMKIS